MDLVHRTTLLIYLTLGEHLQILGERRGYMYKSGICSTRGICDTKPAISLKRSSLERNLLCTECLQKLVYGLSIGDKSGDLG